MRKQLVALAVIASGVWGSGYLLHNGATGVYRTFEIVIFFTCLVGFVLRLILLFGYSKTNG